MRILVDWGQWRFLLMPGYIFYILPNILPFLPDTAAGEIFVFLQDGEIKNWFPFGISRNTQESGRIS